MQSFFFGTLYICGGALCLAAAAFLLMVTVTIGKIIHGTIKRGDFTGGLPLRPRKKDDTADK